MAEYLSYVKCENCSGLGQHYLGGYVGTFYEKRWDQKRLQIGTQAEPSYGYRTIGSAQADSDC
jgi:hypothetical protein